MMANRIPLPKRLPQKAALVGAINWNKLSLARRYLPRVDAESRQQVEFKYRRHDEDPVARGRSERLPATRARAFRAYTPLKIAPPKGRLLVFKGFL